MTEKLAAPPVEVVEKELSQERYKALREELDALIGERVWQQRHDQIQLKWDIGDTIVEALEHAGIRDYAPVIKKLSLDLHVSDSEMYRCVKFKEKFPVWHEVMKKLPEGKNISWNKIRENILPDVPVGRLSLSFPQVEVFDRWGIVKWFSECDHKDTAVIIKDPKFPEISLRISLVKSEKTTGTPLSESLKIIREHYIKTKEWSEKDLDSDDYARIHKAIKGLLVKSKGDISKIKSAITWCSEQKFEWTIETVLKKWADFNKQYRPYTPRAEDKPWMPTEEEKKNRYDPNLRQKLDELLKSVTK